MHFEYFARHMRLKIFNNILHKIYYNTKNSFLQILCCLFAVTTILHLINWRSPERWRQRPNLAEFDRETPTRDSALFCNSTFKDNRSFTDQTTKHEHMIGRKTVSKRINFSFMRQVCLQRDTSCSLYSRLPLSNFYSYTLSYTLGEIPSSLKPSRQDFPSFPQPMRVRFFHKIRSIKEAGIRSSSRIPDRIFTTEREKRREKES